MQLDPGRRFGLTEYGTPGGRPLIWLHGTPGGAGQIPEPLRREAAIRDVRLVAVERPGYGATTPWLYDELGDFASDIERLADRLGIERFAMAALSGGGPYSLATAHAMPDRVVSVAVLGGMTPTVGPSALAEGLIVRLKPLAGTAARFRTPIGLALGGVVRILGPVTDPVWALVTGAFPEGDRAVFADPDMKQMFIDDIRATSRRGLVGVILDFRMFVSDWGFDVGEIAVPVHFWHGDADPLVTDAQAVRLADSIPGATLRVRPGESHLGGFATSVEALSTVLDDWT